MKCSKCGRVVVPGTYVKENGKILCFKCAPHKEAKHPKKSFFRKKKPDTISCPNCHTKFPYNKRVCPSCGDISPVYSFHFWEFFFNVLVGLLIFYIPVFIALIIKDTGLAFLFLGLSFIGVLLSAIILGILFYVGQFVRAVFSRD